MVIDPKIREMFADLYRLAEYYERPPFHPGDIEGNANWFLKANDEALYPFFKKYPDDQLAGDLAVAIVDSANRKALEANKQVTVIPERKGEDRIDRCKNEFP